MESWGTELDFSYLLVTQGKLLSFSWPQFFQVHKSTVLVSTFESLCLNIKQENVWKVPSIVPSKLNLSNIP